MKLRLLLPVCTLLLAACNNNDRTKPEQAKDDSLAKGTYGFDVSYLKKHTRNVVELSDESGQSRVLLSADYQGRVMTSTAMGLSGNSFGWLNYDLIAAPEKKKQFNPFGGEERFWLGPEGGQYSLYFKGKDSFVIKNWQVPAVIDTEAYTLSESDKSLARFTKKASLTNYSGTVFDIAIERNIRLLNSTEIGKKINAEIPGTVHAVGYESENIITNEGSMDWSRETGLLSIWLLGMFTPTPQTFVIIPFHPGPEARSMITDNYFGTIPAERLQIRDSVLIFTCDGKSRGKIGLSPRVAKPIAGSFDFANNVLTLVIPTVKPDEGYVNSKWELQKEPYKGDVINSYNDGPLADGSQLGPFYEIESSSHAGLLLKSGKLEYRQTTCHLQGDYATLRDIAKKLLDVNLDELKK